ncbi:uridine kinase [Reinekea sp. G2M2-21]|uniref:uridine kinase n=1 Tax=Reinekea sp. G2M2-21 TaxID=2788942 RepID=UPI0018ABB80A|nr:uridine kinase [Reinekea sp. G2M2-21]
MNRAATLDEISIQIVKQKRTWTRPLLVGIDGNDGSGKSYFAKELSESLQKSGLTSLVCSIDHFHQTRHLRYRLGKNSPQGFFEDSHNLQDLIDKLILPVRNNENVVTCQIFNSELDEPCLRTCDIGNTDIVFVEGLFLHRDELEQYWDYSIYLQTNFQISVRRGNARFGLNPDPAHTSNFRYVEGNRIYQNRCTPSLRATVVVDNNDLDTAHIV